MIIESEQIKGAARFISVKEISQRLGEHDHVDTGALVGILSNKNTAVI